MVGLYTKVSVQLDFRKKTSFWESVSFHREMFCVTIFWLVLHICIVNAMIFIKKTLINLFRISFYNLLKIIHVINLAILKKLCLLVFSKAIKKFFFFLNLRTSRWTFWKIAERDVFWFLFTQLFFNHFWRKKNMWFTFSRF